MVTENDVQHIAALADVGIGDEEPGAFTHQFNAIIEYFDILDRVEGSEEIPRDRYNIFREDEVEPSLSQDEVLRNAPATEDGFIKAPRVM